MSSSTPSNHGVPLTFFEADLQKQRAELRGLVQLLARPSAPATPPHNALPAPSKPAPQALPTPQRTGASRQPASVAPTSATVDFEADLKKHRQELRVLSSFLRSPGPSSSSSSTKASPTTPAPKCTSPAPSITPQSPRPATPQPHLPTTHHTISPTTPPLPTAAPSTAPPTTPLPPPSSDLSFYEQDLARHRQQLRLLANFLPTPSAPTPSRKDPLKRSPQDPELSCQRLNSLTYTPPPNHPLAAVQRLNSNSSCDSQNSSPPFSPCTPSPQPPAAPHPVSPITPPTAVPASNPSLQSRFFPSHARPITLNYNPMPSLPTATPSFTTPNLIPQMSFTTTSNPVPLMSFTTPNRPPRNPAPAPRTSTPPSFSSPPPDAISLSSTNSPSPSLPSAGAAPLSSPPTDALSLPTTLPSVRVRKEPIAVRLVWDDRRSRLRLGLKIRRPTSTRPHPPARSQSTFTSSFSETSIAPSAHPLATTDTPRGPVRIRLRWCPITKRVALRMKVKPQDLTTAAPPSQPTQESSAPLEPASPLASPKLHPDSSLILVKTPEPQSTTPNSPRTPTFLTTSLSPNPPATPFSTAAPADPPAIFPLLSFNAIPPTSPLFTPPATPTASAACPPQPLSLSLSWDPTLKRLHTRLTIHEGPTPPSTRSSSPTSHLTPSSSSQSLYPPSRGLTSAATILPPPRRDAETACVIPPSSPPLSPLHTPAIEVPLLQPLSVEESVRLLLRWEADSEQLLATMVVVQAPPTSGDILSNEEEVGVKVRLRHYEECDWLFLTIKVANLKQQAPTGTRCAKALAAIPKTSAPSPVMLRMRAAEPPLPPIDEDLYYLTPISGAGYYLNRPVPRRKGNWVARLRPIDEGRELDTGSRALPVALGPLPWRAKSYYVPTPTAPRTPVINWAQQPAFYVTGPPESERRSVPYSAKPRRKKGGAYADPADTAPLPCDPLLTGMSMSHRSNTWMLGTVAQDPYSSQYGAAAADDDGATSTSGWSSSTGYTFSAAGSAAPTPRRGAAASLADAETDDDSVWGGVRAATAQARAGAGSMRDEDEDDGLSFRPPASVNSSVSVQLPLPPGRYYSGWAGMSDAGRSIRSVSTMSSAASIRLPLPPSPSAANFIRLPGLLYRSRFATFEPPPPIPEPMTSSSCSLLSGTSSTASTPRGPCLPEVSSFSTTPTRRADPSPTPTPASPSTPAHASNLEAPQAMPTVSDSPMHTPRASHMPPSSPTPPSTRTSPAHSPASPSPRTPASAASIHATALTFDPTPSSPTSPTTWASAPLQLANPPSPTPSNHSSTRSHPLTPSFSFPIDPELAAAFGDHLPTVEFEYPEEDPASPVRRTGSLDLYPAILHPSHPDFTPSTAAPKHRPSSRWNVFSSDDDSKARAPTRRPSFSLLPIPHPQEQYPFAPTLQMDPLARPHAPRRPSSSCASPSHPSRELPSHPVHASPRRRDAPAPTFLRPEPSTAAPSSLGPCHLPERFDRYIPPYLRPYSDNQPNFIHNPAWGSSSTSSSRRSSAASYVNYADYTPTLAAHLPAPIHPTPHAAPSLSRTSSTASLSQFNTLSSFQPTTWTADSLPAPSIDSLIQRGLNVLSGSPPGAGPASEDFTRNPLFERRGDNPLFASNGDNPLFESAIVDTQDDAAQVPELHSLLARGLDVLCRDSTAGLHRTASFASDMSSLDGDLSPPAAPTAALPLQPVPAATATVEPASEALPADRTDSSAAADAAAREQHVEGLAAAAAAAAHAATAAASAAAVAAEAAAAASIAAADAAAAAVAARGGSGELVPAGKAVPAAVSTKAGEGASSRCDDADAEMDQGPPTPGREEPSMCNLMPGTPTLGSRSQAPLSLMMMDA